MCHQVRFTRTTLLADELNFHRNCGYFLEKISLNTNYRYKKHSIFLTPNFKLYSNVSKTQVLKNMNHLKIESQ